MGLVYLFSLVVGLGILVAQVVMGRGGGHDGQVGHIGGGHGGVHIGGGHGGVHIGGGHTAGAIGAGHTGNDSGHGDSKALEKHGDADDAEAGAVALFFSTRFWIFASFAFGMSGSLIHLFALAGALATFFVALSAGFSSGLFAVLAFRAVKRSSISTSAHEGDAIGQVGRVLVTVGKGKTGQIRVELRGNSVDMLATTDDDAIGRGELILVEDVRGGVAHISRRPPELE